MECTSRHHCLVYEGSPALQLPALTATIQRRLNEGYRCLYLNSKPMVMGIRSSLAALGVDVAAEVQRGRLVLSSDSCVSADGVFDVTGMLGLLEETLDRALRDGYKGLWASGDMTWEFGSEKNFEKLVEYEHRLEEIFSRRPELMGICQYHRDTLPAEVIQQARAVHRSLYVNETLSLFNPDYRCETLPVFKS
ncbi:MEDS: MEthanogen/methylotroph, DcmR Sensory domain [Verrucomicrobium sp. GAS474]|uniref:MEDS domain-containing protein n=1 Tax=Verrucomicrobium sp. GAS474 TaxID=1882831 RepID=UPI00087D847F|nr:MEDS domain-containing protein [Verrucomicrobium sp. GAS474]SDT91608.1 MEDS: MEthanogen/methylotroph, DcmR Sensory domain [Verrucomicrobium sp. GAS474]